jgi:cysteine-rich repeat protein
MENCKLPVCGDGVVHRCFNATNTTLCEYCAWWSHHNCTGEEECDDGNTECGDGCSNRCRYEACRKDDFLYDLSVYGDCLYLRCPTPPVTLYYRDMRREYNLVYWITNYCECLEYV